MLQAIREHTAGWIAGFVLVLLAIPFALWGINNYFVAQVQTWVAKVNGQEISQGDYQQRLSNYRQRMRQMLGENFDPEMLEKPDFKRQFLEDMIRSRVLLQAAQDAGFEVPPQRIASEIASYPALQENGKFSPERYRQALQSIGMTPTQFENQVRDDLLTNEVVGSLQNTALVTDQEVNNLIRLQNQTRDFKYFLLPADRFSDQVSVSDDEIKKYYDDHPDAYMTEEKVSIRYLELSASEIAKTIKVDEPTLRAWFKDNQSSYVTNEQRLASHILIQVPDDATPEQVAAAKAKAEKAAERVRNGEDFAKVAKEMSDDPGSAASGGDLGWLEKGQMPDAFEKALFSLKKGQVSDPVKTGYGFHVIKLRDIQEPKGKTFEEARQQVASDYKASESERIYLEQADRLVDLTYENPSSLQPAADALDLKIQEAGPFSRDGGKGIASNPDVVKTAFSDLVLQDRLNSDPVEMGPNHVIVMRVTDHEPSKRRPLEDVSDDIRQTLVTDKARKVAEGKAEEAVKALSSGDSDLAALASQDGSEVVSAEGAKRQAADYPAQLLGEVFKLPAPKGPVAYHAVAAGNGDRAVVALSAIHPGDPSKASDADRQRVRQQLARAYVGAEINAMVDNLEKKADVKIAEDRL